MDILAYVALVAAVIEGTVEYIGNDLSALPGWAKKLAALILGVGVALLGQLDVLPFIQNEVVGEILTGLIIGRGANYVHNILGEHVQ